MNTFVFEVRRFAGDRGIGLVGSLSVWLVSGIELTIVSTSVNSVQSYSSLGLVPWFSSIDDSIFWHYHICFSQTLPMWLTASQFFENFSRFVPKLANIDLNLLLYTMVEASFNSFSQPKVSSIITLD